MYFTTTICCIMLHTHVHRCDLHDGEPNWALLLSTLFVHQILGLSVLMSFPNSLVLPSFVAKAGALDEIVYHTYVLSHFNSFRCFFLMVSLNCVWSSSSNRNPEGFSGHLPPTKCSNQASTVAHPIFLGLKWNRGIQCQTSAPNHPEGQDPCPNSWSTFDRRQGALGQTVGTWDVTPDDT